MRFVLPMRNTLAALIALLSPSTAWAETEPVVLWRTLATGDTPEAVATKLAGDQIFKSVKVKRSANPAKEPTLSIKYNGYGVDVLGVSFQLVPTFERGVLRKVALQTGPTCANRAPEQFRNIATLLHEKYPTSPVEFDVSDDEQVRKARREGTDENPMVAGRVFQGGGVTVSYQQTFTAEEAPPIGYVSNPKVSALMSLLANQYEYRARECDGTGNHRMTHSLVYMTNADFDLMHKSIIDEHKATTQAAKSNL